MSSSNNIAVIQATSKLLEVYLEHNQVPHDRFADFIKEVNASILSCVQADMNLPNSIEGMKHTSALTPTTEIAQTTASADAVQTQAPKRRGRPPKNATAPVAAAPVAVAETTVASSEPTAPAEPVKRGRGRPRTRPDYAAIREASSVEGLSDDPDAPNYRFSMLPRTPAVPVEKSFGPDFVICLLDGRKMKVMKKHLRARYNMSEEQYRRHFNLAADHPITSPDFIEKKSLDAKSRNFGKKVVDQDEGFRNEAPVIKRSRTPDNVAA